jgi:nucleotide-binding universal stress UspA family protein
MGDFKRILIAIAFTPQAQDMMRYAADVAAKIGAEELIAASIINNRDVEAVSTISALGYDVDGDNYVKSIKAERGDLLDSYTRNTAFPVEKIRPVIKVGDPVDELLKIVVKEQVDLMVMGTKGRTNLEYALVGSVAEKIFRRSPVPILSYRSKEHAERLRKNIRIS